MYSSLCKICASSTDACYDVVVLAKFPAKMSHCSKCGFLNINEPVWLEEAYSSAISILDTGLVHRSLSLSKRLVPLLYHLFRGEAVFADIAGGTGLLTRLMRDYGFDFYWYDAYCENVHAKGFEYSPELGRCHAVTAFEVIEHVEAPLKFIKETIDWTNAEVFIFTTQLYSGVPPRPEDWWYYSLETGQHLSFYKRETLQLMAEKLGFEYLYLDGLHFYSREQHLQSLKRFCNSRLVQFLSKKAASRELNSRVVSDRDAMLNRIRAFGSKKEQ